MEVSRTSLEGVKNLPQLEENVQRVGLEMRHISSFGRGKCVPSSGPCACVQCNIISMCTV